MVHRFLVRVLSGGQSWGEWNGLRQKLFMLVSGGEVITNTRRSEPCS